MRAPRGPAMEQFPALCDWLGGNSGDRVGVDGGEAGTSGWLVFNLSKGRLKSVPHSSKERLSGPPRRIVSSVPHSSKERLSGPPRRIVSSVPHTSKSSLCGPPK